MLDEEKLDIVTAFEKQGYDEAMEDQALEQARASVAHSLGVQAEALPPHMENFAEAYRTYQTEGPRSRRLVGGAPFIIKR